VSQCSPVSDHSSSTALPGQSKSPRGGPQGVRKSWAKSKCAFELLFKLLKSDAPERSRTPNPQIRNRWRAGLYRARTASQQEGIGRADREEGSPALPWISEAGLSRGWRPSSGEQQQTREARLGHPEIAASGCHMVAGNS
jgi:hypothetical protein